MLTVFKLKDIAILSRGLERYRIAGGLEVNEKFSATLSIRIQPHASDLEKLLEDKLSRRQWAAQPNGTIREGRSKGWGLDGLYSAESVIRWSFCYMVCSSLRLSVGKSFCYLHMRATKKYRLSKMWLRLLILYY